MKKLILFFAILFSMGMQAQKADVKYVNVRNVYDFQTEANEYRLNSALKNKMQSLGYIVYFDNEIPEDVRLNPCLEYRAELTEIKSSTATKLNLAITDCKGKIVFSKEGVSKLKLHKKSYIDAFNKIFEYSNIDILAKK